MEKTMGRAVLFRIRILAIAAAVLVMHGPANALWLEVTNTSSPEQALPLASFEGKGPVPGDQRRGLFAVPPSYGGNPAPRLSVQYRASFPLSVTVSADGALAGEKVTAAGGMNLSTGVVFTNAWWSPRVSASADFSTLEMIEGHLEYGTATVRSEWKIKF
jgi:hypothetical protein